MTFGDLWEDVLFILGLLVCAPCSIRHITAEVGASVLRAAVAEELAEGHGDKGPRELAHMSKV